MNNRKTVICHVHAQKNRPNIRIPELDYYSPTARFGSHISGGRHRRYIRIRENGELEPCTNVMLHSASHPATRTDAATRRQLCPNLPPTHKEYPLSGIQSPPQSHGNHKSTTATHEISKKHHYQALRIF